ncbi:MAG: aspartate kinase [Alphaproteobacteria bacterium]
MARIVMKFGGTSVGDIDRIRSVARRVKAEWDDGNEVAVVVSAMSGETNRLVELCKVANPMHDLREYDTVVSTGEQVTVGLLAIILQSMGVEARSWLAWQLPFKTSNSHGNANIDNIDGSQIIARFETQDRQVAVIPGFQGISPLDRVTTLGRGGSDTSAVAIAAALKADRCDIYTDVDGVYTTDPRLVPRAQKIDRVSHEEMLEMASLGAKVLQTRSVALAMRYQMPLQVLSSFENKPGTFIVPEEKVMETADVTGIPFSKAEARITLNGVPDRPGTSALIFSALGDAGINVDMIVQSQTNENQATDMTFTVTDTDMDRAVSLMESRRVEIGYQELVADDKVAKVSIVGVGMRTNSGVAQKMFRTLSEKGINIKVITTSEIKVSVLVAEEYLELAVRALHSEFGLDV